MLIVRRSKGCNRAGLFLQSPIYCFLGNPQSLRFRTYLFRVPGTGQESTLFHGEVLLRFPVQSPQQDSNMRNNILTCAITFAGRREPAMAKKKRHSRAEVATKLAQANELATQ